MIHRAAPADNLADSLTESRTEDFAPADTAERGEVLKPQVVVAAPAAAPAAPQAAAAPAPQKQKAEVPEYTPVIGQIDPTPVSVFIQSTIRSVEWRESRRDSKIKIGGLKGYAVEESDTARGVSLRTTRGWFDAMTLRKVGDDLIIDVSLDKFSPILDRRHTVRTGHFIAATLVVPRGMLQSASVGKRTLYIESFRARKFEAASQDRIVVNHSRIDTLCSMGNTLTQLKLDNSTIATADIYRVNNSFSVECTSKASRIDLLYIEGVRVGRFATVDLRKANVGCLKWNPENRGVKVKVLSTVPVTTILPPSSRLQKNFHITY